VTKSCRFLQALALGAWIGAIIFFAGVVTRGAFAVLSSRDEAGALVGFTLAGLHEMGAIAAVIYLVAAVGIERSWRGLGGPAAFGVILMLALTLTSQRIVIPRIDVLRVQMGSVEATAASDPLRAEFDRLHSVSVDLEGAVLAIGLAAMWLTMRERNQ
jgi:amino acid transporter